jgi:hypothetical protein
MGQVVRMAAFARSPKVEPPSARDLSDLYRRCDEVIERSKKVLERHGSGSLLSGSRREHGMKIGERGEPRIRDVPVHELGNPRVADARLVGDALPLTTARLQSVPHSDIKGGVHGSSVAKFCDFNKQHFATPVRHSGRMGKKSANQVLAEALTFFKDAQGWNYTTLGRKAGLVANTIKNYCSAEREVSPSGKERSAKLTEIEQLAEAMDLQVVDLLTDATDDDRRKLLRKRAAEYYEAYGTLPHWAPGRVITEGGQDEGASGLQGGAQRRRAGA